MHYLDIAMRLLHVVLGALWVGFAVFVAFILGPALAEAGPDGARVITLMVKGGYDRIIAALAGTTILAGILLFWRASGGFQPEYMGSPTGIGLSIGALAALVAYGVGLTMVRPSMRRVATLTQGLAALSSDSERATRVAAIAALRARGAAGGRITALLLLLATAAMAVARYL